MTETYFKSVPPLIRKWCKKKYPKYMTIEAIAGNVDVCIYSDDYSQTGIFSSQIE